MNRIVILVFFMTTVFSSCEKDDVCSESTSTTPRLIIDFYDLTNPTLKKDLSSIGILGEGLNTVIVFNNVSTVQVPLDITKDISKYQFILNYGNSNPAFINTDQLQFDYTRSNVYISRACGYKTLFTLDETNPFTQTDGATLDALWMRNITVLQSTISNEDETHLSISF
jgi:Family of unknown function (DUF6452)